MNERRDFPLGFLTRASVREIETLSPHAIELARRWIEEWPEQARQLDATGKLIPALKKHAETDALRQWRERRRTIGSRSASSELMR